VTEDQTPGDEETFSSDVIDLGAVDLSGLDRVPSPVLRASLRRVLSELADGDEVSAYFQNSLRDDSWPENSS
jgi:FXSXX-COOH protein